MILWHCFYYKLFRVLCRTPLSKPTGKTSSETVHRQGTGTGRIKRVIQTPVVCKSPIMTLTGWMTTRPSRKHISRPTRDQRTRLVPLPLLPHIPHGVSVVLRTSPLCREMARATAGNLTNYRDISSPARISCWHMRVSEFMLHCVHNCQSQRRPRRN